MLIGKCSIMGRNGVFERQKENPDSDREHGVSRALTRLSLAVVPTEEGAVRQEVQKEGEGTVRPFSNFWSPVSNAQL